MTHHPSLWFSDADVEVVRRRVREGEPTAAAIFEKAEALSRQPLGEQTADFGQYAVACAVHYLVTGAPNSAELAHDALLAMTAGWSTGNLTLGSWALYGAVVHECCYNGWTPEQQIRMTALLVKLARCQREVIPQAGNPHIVTNNHWAVSHGGSAMAAMAAHGHASDLAGGVYDLTEDIQWARARTTAFIMHHGDQGLYHEGLGYQCYPASFWLPMLIATKRFEGIDLLERFPHLRNMAASLYASVAARPAVSDTDKPATGVGVKLSWNDDGLGWNASNTAILMIAIAHRHQQGALRWMYDHLNGIHGDAGFCAGWGGLLFTLFYYPYDIPAVAPNGILPNHLTDSRQGLSLFRNRYQDADDAILGCYARATFVGGHAQDDAGSVRFMALGHDWIMGGGQARGAAEYQSVVMPADGSRADPAGLGAVICDEADAHGGVYGMDVRKANVAYAERYVAVDYSGAAGVPAALALLDLVDDHQGRDWWWNMTFERGLVCTLHEDHAGFTLTADDGASLEARFLGAVPDALELTATPDSTRTFQGGHQALYPGRPIVRATFKAREYLGVYVVMTVQRGVAPAIVAEEGVAVRLGAHLWARPFGPAVPTAFQPGRSGVLCRYPAGEKDFTVREVAPTR